MARVRRPARPPAAETYRHREAESPLRPDVGTQAQFRKRKPPVIYRYDSSLSPALDWDGQNGAREFGEWLLARIDEAARLPAPHNFDKPRQFLDNRGQVLTEVAGLHDVVEQLRRLGKPLLNWAGKAERLSFDVPTLPLFIHERLSTKAIIETLKGHRRDPQMELELFADPQHSITDQVLRAYEHRDKWVNRMILGDSLVVMNSLLHFEGLGGQVQMIYMDPPYGVKFGSNFQPFVRKRDVGHNDDEDMTREPEMVKAYRDTWELGLQRKGGGLYVGSGLCVRIGDRYLIATAKHNLQDDNCRDLQISDFEVRPRGKKYGEPLEVRSMGLAPNVDLAWLEVNPETSKRPHLAFVTVEEIASLREDKGQQACSLLGYSKEMAEKPSNAQERPLLESACVVTLSILPSGRQAPNDPNTFAIEWPPHDGSLNDSLPEPHGVSGGGVWLLPKHDDYLVWSSERARLVGIARAWWREERERWLCGSSVGWNSFADQIPELRDEVTAILQKIARKRA